MISLRNMLLISMCIATSLMFAAPGCSWSHRNRKKSSDTTSPVPGNRGEITVSDIRVNRVTLSWTKATDDTLSQESLEYKVVRSNSGNVDTVAKAEANGTVVRDWTVDIAMAIVTGLAPNTLYYFNVLVRDRAGNRAAYRMTSATTAPLVFTGFDITTDADNTESVALGDMDGDGDLDIVAANAGGANVTPNVSRLYRNDGAGNCTGSDITGVTSSSFCAALGDMDGDGDLDIVIGNSFEESWLYLNDGTGNFSGSAVTEIHTTRAVAIGDIDKDDDLDIVLGNDFFEINQLYKNDGAGTFTRFDIAADADDTTSVALGDVNGDGHLDIVVGNYGQVNRLHLNDGAGNFLGSIDIPDDALPTTSVAIGDMDGDGDLDIVAVNDNEHNRLYKNGGAGTFAGSDISLDTLPARSVALGDMDGDGDLDIVVGNDNDVNRLYFNDGTGNFTGSDITTDLYQTNSVALGDMDGDGDLDIVVGNYDLITGVNRLYLSNLARKVSFLSFAVTPVFGHNLVEWAK